MKKAFLIFVALIMVSPAFAVGVGDGDESKPVAASYVKEAYNALDSAKQSKLFSSGENPNLVVNDTGSAGKPVTEIVADGSTVTVKRSEVTVPVGSASSPTGRATIWIQ